MTRHSDRHPDPFDNSAKAVFKKTYRFRSELLTNNGWRRQLRKSGLAVIACPFGRRVAARTNCDYRFRLINVRLLNQMADESMEEDIQVDIGRADGARTFVRIVHLPTVATVSTSSCISSSKKSVPCLKSPNQVALIEGSYT